MRKRTRGQSTLEYAVIIAVVVGGLMAMQYYIKRGYAGRLRASSDEMGEQFDPYAYKASLTYNQSSNVTQTATDTGSKTWHREDQVSKKTGSENVTAFNLSDGLYGTTTETTP